MSRQKTFFLILAGFASGVFVRSFVKIDWGLAALLGVCGIFLFVFARTRDSRALIFTGIFLAAFGLGILRYELKDQTGVSLALKSQIGQSSVLTGVIIDEPDERENSTRLILKTGANDKILLVASRYPEYFYGDILEVRGILKEPENFSDFDYKSYLAKDEIFLEMFYPEIKKAGSGGGSRLKETLFLIKAKYLENLSRAVAEPEASFLAGLTVGVRRAIPKKVLDDFTKVGAIHVVALSGYNVTIVARAVAGFFGSFLPYFASVSAGLAGIFLFAVLTGASATVVRASIMAAILYFAGLSGRVYEARTALFTAGFLMLLFNPNILRFDLSFQLSFLATLGLIYFSPFFERSLKWFPEKLGLRQSAVATMSAQLAVLPLLLYNTGTFSVVALPANILILIAVPWAMFFGFLTGVAGWIHAWLALPFGWLAYFLTAYQLYVADVFARLPFSQIEFWF